MVTEIVDLDLGSKSSFKIVTMEGDICSRFIEFHLSYNGEVFNLQNKSVKCRYVNGRTTEEVNLVINDRVNGVCTLEIPYRITSNAQNGKCELVISQSGEILSTIPFSVEVAKSLVERATVESSNEFGALNNALWKIDGVNAELNNINSQLDTKANKDDVARISSGTPLFATSTNEMTDIKKNYVNTTDGYLYIYSGGQWNKTGVLYQSTGLDDGQVKLKNLNDEILMLMDYNETYEILPNSNIKDIDHIDVGINSYIIDRPICKNTLKKITKIKLFCNKKTGVNYVFVNLGYFLNGKFEVYSSNKLSAIYGVNEYDVNIEINTNVTTYIAICGSMTYNTVTTDNYFKITGQVMEVGSHSYTLQPHKLTFEIAVTGIDGKTEKIIELNNKIEEIKNKVDKMVQYYV